MSGENASTFILDPPATVWAPAGTMSNPPGNSRGNGGVVILPLSTSGGTSTQILTAGGNTGQNGAGCPTNTSEIYTVGASTPWAPFPGNNRCMCYARYNHNMVLLADGTVLAVQGGNGETGMMDDYAGPIATPELYTPSTGQWRVLKAYVDPINFKAVNRTYHSTALLLPDGRVLSAGSDTFSHGLPGTNDNKFQIFSPPYMFAATRPVISSVSPSPSITYGSTITITTPDSATAASITKVALVRPGATTHANDMEQRYVTLVFHVNPQNSAQLIANLPSNNATGQSTAPPGYYMLFIVNSSNIPSVSYIAPAPVGTFLQLQIP